MLAGLLLLDAWLRGSRAAGLVLPWLLAAALLRQITRRSSSRSSHFSAGVLARPDADAILRGPFRRQSPWARAGHGTASAPALLRPIALWTSSRYPHGTCSSRASPSTAGSSQVVLSRSRRGRGGGMVLSRGVAEVSARHHYGTGRRLCRDTPCGGAIPGWRNTFLPPHNVAAICPGGMRVLRSARKSAPLVRPADGRTDSYCPRR